MLGIRSQELKQSHFNTAVTVLKLPQKTSEMNQGDITKVIDQILVQWAVQEQGAWSNLNDAWAVFIKRLDKNSSNEENRISSWMSTVQQKKSKISA